MKKLGFIDFYLDEWHANNYPAMIEAYNKSHNADYKVAFAWGETEPEGKLTTSEWCEKFGAEKCGTIAEICEKADHIIILAPSDPDKHLGYAGEVFAAGVSPYIDKTFAPDHETAEKIFALAKEHGVKFFSSSALRYGDELRQYSGDAKAVFTTGGGSNLEEYVIHQIEMIVKCLGTGANEVVYEPVGDGGRADIFYENGKRAGLAYAPALPFTAVVTDKDGRTSYRSVNSDYFGNLIADIMRFFETGETAFDTAETLEVMKIRDTVITGKAKPGEKIRV